MSFTLLFVIQVFYLLFGPSDPDRSATTGAIVIRTILYIFAIVNTVMILGSSFQQLAVPNNIWHDFTDTICKIHPYYALQQINLMANMNYYICGWKKVISPFIYLVFPLIVICRVK